MYWFRSTKKSCNHLNEFVYLQSKYNINNMKDFFYAIQDLFVNVLFLPFDSLRQIELENWWIANTMTWLLTIIGLVAFVYWMLQLRKFDQNNEEDKSVTSHSYL